MKNIAPNIGPRKINKFVSKPAKNEPVYDGDDDDPSPQGGYQYKSKTPPSSGAFRSATPNLKRRGMK